jgi:hypothetical protein
MITMTITYLARCKHCAWVKSRGRGKKTLCTNPASANHGEIRQSDTACDSFLLFGCEKP